MFNMMLYTFLSHRAAWRAAFCATWLIAATAHTESMAQTPAAPTKPANVVAKDTTKPKAKADTATAARKDTAKIATTSTIPAIIPANDDMKVYFPAAIVGFLAGLLGGLLGGFIIGGAMRRRKEENTPLVASMQNMDISPELRSRIQQEVQIATKTAFNAMRDDVKAQIAAALMQPAFVPPPPTRQSSPPPAAAVIKTYYARIPTPNSLFHTHSLFDALEYGETVYKIITDTRTPNTAVLTLVDTSEGRDIPFKNPSAYLDVACKLEGSGNPPSTARITEGSVVLDGGAWRITKQILVQW